MSTHDSSGLDAVFSSLLEARKLRNLHRRLQTPTNAFADFSSNDYLSLSRDSNIKRDYISYLQASGVDGNTEFRLGSGGSRLLDGNTKLAESLECSLAEFYQAPTGLLFNSGFDANTGLFASVPQVGDVVVYDEFIHASVHAGLKLSRASRTIPFKHNSVWDEDLPDAASKGDDRSSLKSLESLSQILQRLVQDHDGMKEIKTGRRHVFIAVESVYSMDGDIAALQDIARCVEHHLPLGNGHIIVDEAHSTGIFGIGGRGLVCQLELEKRIWARVHTFGKAMGCSGGMLWGFCLFSLFLSFSFYPSDLVHVSVDANTSLFWSQAIILCSAITREYLINYARTFIYTTAMGFPELASIQIAHQAVTGDQADTWRLNLYALINHVYAQLVALCSQHDSSGRIIKINTGASTQSPIIPVFTSQARSLAMFCQRRGYMVRPIVAPTVPYGTDRVRICLHARNTIEECDGLCRAIKDWVLTQQKMEGQVSNAVQSYSGDQHVRRHKL